jgi:hypothetical protein
VQTQGNTGNSYIIADDLVMGRTLALLTQGQFALGEDIADWAKIAEAAKIRGRPASSLASNSVPCMIKSQSRPTLSSVEFNPATTNWILMGPQRCDLQGCLQASGD